MSDDLLLGWADDLMVHGHGLARWIVDYVDLEESLAVGSISQEELAHARTVLEACGLGPAEREDWVFTREPADWSPATLALSTLDWPSTVGAAYLISLAGAVLLEALAAGGDDATLAEVAPIMQPEQQLHLRHWERWVSILSRDPETSTEFAAALEAALADSADLFGEPAPAWQGGTALPAGHDRATLHQRWAERAQATLSALDLDGSSAPPVPKARQPGTAHPRLLEMLSTMRSVRTASPDSIYGGYE